MCKNEMSLTLPLNLKETSNATSQFVPYHCIGSSTGAPNAVAVKQKIVATYPVELVSSTSI